MQNVEKTVSIIGLGYIGLPTAGLLAAKGYKVYGCDTNAEIVATINRGDIHIHESELDVLIKVSVNSGHLKAFIEPKPADIYILSVPTPLLGNHQPDLSYVKAATESIAPLLKANDLVILESTSPVGTTEKVVDWITALRMDLCVSCSENSPKDKKNSIFIAYCPERVLPGKIIKELITNDRIVGGINQSSAEMGYQFYSTFIDGQILMTNARTAEMVKLAENAFRDVNIAFANELSIVCDALDIDVWELIELANHHPRVNILKPGPGVGGHCIAVDPWFIVDSAPKETQLIRMARQVNDSKPEYIFNKIRIEAGKFKHPHIACLGLTFKADVDDLRESPALAIVERLAKEAVGQLLVVEPHIETLPKNFSQYSQVEFVNIEQATNSANIIVLLVDHQIFCQINPGALAGKVLIDTRGVW